MRKAHSLLALGSLAIALAAAPAYAENTKQFPEDAFAAERFRLRARAIAVLPDESSSVNIGGDAKVGNAIVPEVDVSYFFTKNIAAELIAATSQHHLSHNAAGDLGRAWLLPPTLTVQYHFTPDAAFSPYVGAGLNYSFFYGEKSAKGNGITKLDVDGGLGYALQAGADYWLSDNWGLNVDVKKLFLNVDAKLNNGAVRADVDLDPWIIGAGVSYRF